MTFHELLRFNETLEKTCLFHFNEADGLGIVSAFIVLTNSDT